MSPICQNEMALSIARSFVAVVLARSVVEHQPLTHSEKAERQVSRIGYG
jgi:hypothetical protein